MRIALVVTVLLLLCGVGICAESQRKSEGEIKPTEAQQMIGDKQRDTKETSAVVKIIPPKRDKVESDADAKEKEEKKTLDRRLVFFTACLAAIGLMQLVVFGLQARRLRQTVEATKEAADAANKSADVAEKALELVERPYIFAHSVSKFHISENLNPAITYEVANFGKTPAIIQSAHVALENIKNNLGAVLEVDRQHTLVSAPILSAGEVRKGIEEELPANMVNFITTGKGYAPDLKHGEDLFFRVIIRYRGPFTEGHESSFCWRYNSHTNYFTPYEHENYNYTK